MRGKRVRLSLKEKLALLLTVLLLAAALRLGCLVAEQRGGQKRENPPEESESVSETEAAAFTVVLDPGHGGTDPGKIGGNGAEEQGINLAISLKLKELLLERGVRVILTREDEGSLCEEGRNRKREDLRARCAVIDGAGADLAVSIHQNSFGEAYVAGPQVFYHEGSAEGKRAAVCLQKALNEELGTERPREIKANDSYYLLKNTVTPAVIAECGFLSNPREAKLLLEESYQERAAAALAEGICSYLELLGKGAAGA